MSLGSRRLHSPEPPRRLRLIAPTLSRINRGTETVSTFVEPFGQTLIFLPCRAGALAKAGYLLFTSLRRNQITEGNEGNEARRRFGGDKIEKTLDEFSQTP